MPSDIQTLQKDTINLLEGVSKLMQKARDVLRDDAERYEGYRKNISHQLDNVKNLELRMSIVAPMKAGKSTIINAILGQKLLPSRSSAMTTLPTEIVFKGNIDTPQLMLRRSFIQPFGTALSELKTSLEQRQDAAEIEPSLKPLIEKIKTDSLTISALIQSQDPHVYQDEKINEVLEELNDIIRLCGDFNLLENPLNFLRESLQVEVPAKAISDSIPGNFIIVDTPGPNEAGGNAQLLSEVVSMQLQRSSLVLVVIDFTQRKTIAADKVKQEVEKIVNMRGKKGLYVVINKVDQRKAGDPSSEELVQQIASQFKIEPESIFKLSAWRAFIVRNFLREFAQNPNGNIHDPSQYQSLAEAARFLAEELFLTGYDRKFKKSTAKSLKEEAEELIELTGFDELYSNALESMLFASAPTSLEIALNLCKNQLADLKATIALNQSASQNDITTLQSNLEELKKKLDQINSLREGQYEQEKAKQQFQSLEDHVKRELDILNHKLQTILRRSKREPQKNFGVQELEEMEWHEIRVIDAFHDVLEPIFLNKLFDAGLRGYRFDNREEAERANEKVKDIIVDLIILLNEKVMEYFNEDILGVHTQEIESLANEGLAVQIAKEIRTDLNRNLSINLPSIPEFVLPQLCQRSDANFTRILKEKKINLVGKLYNRFMKICGQQQRQISDTFSIDIESYVHMANSLNQEAIKHVGESSQEFLSRLDTALDEHFHKVEDTLNRYKISLEQGIRSNDLNVDEREKFYRSIDALKDNVTRLEEKMNETLEYIEAITRE